ncbi:unnamed protein product [Mucor hiemalis]
MYRKSATEFDYVKAQYQLGHMYHKGIGIKVDFRQAMVWYKKAARKDHVEAQFKIGRMYDFGEGVNVNYKEAMRWYQLAAKKKHAGAQKCVGYLHEFGEGVDVDFEEAMRWYKLAAGQGLMTAQFNIGIMYNTGKGVSVNLKEAFQWYLKAAQNEEHDADSFYRVGLAYLNGLGVEKNIKQGLNYLRTAAEDDHKMAQLTLGLYYMNGFGVRTDFKQAIKWLVKSEHLESLLCVAHMYEKGLGVDQDFKKANYYYDLSSETVDIDVTMAELGTTFLTMDEREKSVEQALFWFKKAAEKDNVHSLISIGSMYMMDLNDKKIDIENAFQYLSRAALLEQVPLTLNQLKPSRDLEPGEKYSASMKWYTKSLDGGVTVKEGCISGLSCIGYMYHQGLGVQPDFSRAQKIYQNVLEDINDDDSDANLCLGLLYLKGLGVMQDHKKAMEYFKRSAKTINTYTYNLIGDAYRFGYGVYINEKKAMEWYLKGTRYGDGYSQLNVGKIYLDSPNFSVGRYVQLGWFRDSYQNGCKEALKFIQSLGENDLQTSTLLLNERVAREVAEKEALQLKAELERVKAENDHLAELAATVQMVPPAQIQVEERETYQFFHL